MSAEDGAETGGIIGGGEEGATYTDVEHESYFSGIGNSFGGICFGIVLFIGAFPLLWWNEGRAVDYYQAIAEGQRTIVPINTTSIDSANEGGLVYLTGLAEPTDDVMDTDFGIEADLKTRLFRHVEMYQWRENKTTKKNKNVGGGTSTYTEYSYSKTWSESNIDSTKFRETGYNNPNVMPYSSQFFYPTAVTIDAFTLPNELVDGISSLSPLDGTFNISDIPSQNVLASSTIEQTYPNGFYFGVTSSSSYTNEAIGDTRVTYSAAGSGQVSIIAQQTGSTFAPYTASSGADLYLLEAGNISSNEMFENAKAGNKAITMVLRFVGFVVMAIGIGLMMGPIAAVADIIPCLGDCVGGAISIVAGLIAAVLSLVVIGIAWVSNRPIILGIGGAVAGVVLILLYSGYRTKNQQKPIDHFPNEKDIEMSR